MAAIRSAHAPSFTYKDIIRSIFRPIARFYTVGPRTVDEAVGVCQQLARAGIPSTLGGFSDPRADPTRIVREYCWASDHLRGSTSFYLSVRLVALHFDVPSASAITATALTNGHGIHLDSFGPELADHTLDLLERLHDTFLPGRYPARDWSFSLSLPARWARSLPDAERVAARAMRARVVKGEFAACTPSEAVPPATGFLTLATRLAGAVPELALATHDDVLAREAITRCRTAAGGVRLELLYGLPMDGMLRLARELRVPIGIYVPYGELLLLYATRMVMRSPRKLRWAMRGLLDKRAAASSRTERILQTAGPFDA
jgi:proline dehydrogenase